MRIQVGPAIVEVEVVSTPEHLARGLAGHAPLGPGRGMLFVFAQAGRHVFWMRGVAFPIDVVFVGLDGRVAEVFERAASGSEVPFGPATPTQFVIELPAGFVHAAGIRVGDAVSVSDGQ